MATEVDPTPRSTSTRGPSKRTIGTLWRDAVAEERPFPAYLVETEQGWEPVSWQEAGRRVDELANGLLALGIRKGDAVAILGPTRIEWALLDYALALVGAVIAPIYADSTAKDCAYAIGLVEAVAVFVDESQRRSLEEAIAGISHVAHVISFGGLDEIAGRGRELAAERPEALRDAEEAVQEDDLFTYIYTSGTTGPPKACMILHRNYYEMADTVARLEEFTMRGDTMLLYLPLAHNFGRLMHLDGAHIGFTIAFLADPFRAAEALPAVRPSVFPSVPRLYEKVHARVRAQFDATTGLRRKLIDWALGVGYHASPYKRAGRRLPLRLGLQHGIADRLVYSKVKKRLGGRLRVGISGGAPLAKEIAEFFHALDILILEGYGLSECTTACSANRPGRIKFGTVGTPLPGFEVRVADDGEILIRSETIFAGYYRDEEATRDALTGDGWLRSGDVGELDEDGFLRITDRKKDIIVTAGGKNASPQNVENALKSAALVSQALVVGDRRPFLTALITLDQDEAGKWARERGLDPDPARLAREPQLDAAVKEVVDSVNRDLSRFEQVKKFAVLPRDFSADHDEVTPTMKIKRRAVEQNFAREIEALYSELR